MLDIGCGWAGLVTGKDAVRFKFKMPTLRNVELTYPYFHDGAAQTLTEAVDTNDFRSIRQPSAWLSGGIAPHPSRKRLKIVFLLKYVFI